MSKVNALVLIDYVNEIVHSDGKLSGKGYSDFISRHGTSEKVAELLEKSRQNGWIICHVRVGFDPSYVNHPEDSPLFGAAKKFGALNQDEWGCEFIDFAAPMEGEVVIQKRRVSAFFNTELDTVLRVNGIKNVFFGGCATDLAVQAAVRDAHDRDFTACVVSDACAAANDTDHDTSLPTLEKIARICTVAEI
ncbi:isochorismatase family cysteine hydrolase [Yoonia sp. GPGPB17]|uniref:cysteine hydrolase family protein n=1 Tax=Yoonia sp. GPGPB17 TaxID=3026147 RepID=UPI0030BE34C2